MQILFKWSEHPFWKIRDSGFTFYIRTCKGCLSYQDIPFGQLEALDSPTILKHIKIIWAIRIFLLKSEAWNSHSILNHAKIVWVIKMSLLSNQWYWTHSLYWNMQSLFEWSEHLFWKIKDTGLTAYVGTCKHCFSGNSIYISYSYNQMHL